MTTQEMKNYLKDYSKLIDDGKYTPIYGRVSSILKNGDIVVISVGNGNKFEIKSDLIKHIFPDQDANSLERLFLIKTASIEKAVQQTRTGCDQQLSKFEQNGAELNFSNVSKL